MTGSTWVGTSWKMNKTLAESLNYIDVLTQIAVPPSIQAFVLPPLTSLAAVRSALPASSRVRLGAQNAHWAPEGAGTGEVSMRMVQDAGADLVEIGHSERRLGFGESDETVARKVQAATAQGLTPLLCVGEDADVRRAGAAESWVLGQIRSALTGLSTDRRRGVIIAYEPIWAIGTGGRAAEPAEVAPVMAAISEAVAGHGGCLALLYGGSVRPDNAATLLADPHTDGVFVGRAAWSAEGLIELIGIAAHAHP